MNEETVRNQIESLKNRFSKLNRTADNARNLSDIEGVIESHEATLAETLQNVAPQFLERELVQMSKDMNGTEKAMTWHENQWGIQG